MTRYSSRKTFSNSSRLRLGLSTLRPAAMAMGGADCHVSRRLLFIPAFPAKVCPGNGQWLGLRPVSGHRGRINLSLNNKRTAHVQTTPPRGMATWFGTCCIVRRRRRDCDANATKVWVDECCRFIEDPRFRRVSCPEGGKASMLLLISWKDY